MVNSGKRLVIAPQALGDLVGIGRYLRKAAGFDTARHFLIELEAKLAWIAGSGTSGVSREHISPGLRALLHKDRTIYFRIFDWECQIVRVLHSRQEPTAQAFGIARDP